MVTVARCCVCVYAYMLCGNASVHVLRVCGCVLCGGSVSCAVLWCYVCMCLCVVILLLYLYGVIVCLL